MLMFHIITGFSYTPPLIMLQSYHASLSVAPYFKVFGYFYKANVLHYYWLLIQQVYSHKSYMPKKIHLDPQIGHSHHKNNYMLSIQPAHPHRSYIPRKDPMQTLKQVIVTIKTVTCCPYSLPTPIDHIYQEKIPCRPSNRSLSPKNLT